MTDPNGAQRPGWTIGRSIAMELDVALSVFAGVIPEGDLPEEAARHVAAMAAEWREQWPELLGPRRKWISVMAGAAMVAGVLFEEDYGRATLAIRDLTLAQAIARAEEMAAAVGVTVAPDLAPADRLADLLFQMTAHYARLVGLEVVSEAHFVRRARQDAEAAVRFLRDGDLHSRFWLWLDQFYFEFYRPWRASRAAQMESEEQRAIRALGARDGEGAPATGWLPGQNPLVHREGAAEAVRSGQLRVFFWTQPFGLFDHWSFGPGTLMITYGESREAFAHFREEASGIADRAKAISDPTRLMILRIIRHFGMDNTQMAAYLGVARPTVSIHAKLLREAGLIDTRQEGRAALHAVNPAGVRRLFRDLQQFLDLPEE